MRYLAVAWISSALALTFAHSASAQNASPPRPLARGDRVRLTASGDSTTIVGSVLRLDADQVVVAPADSGAPPRTVARSAISHLEIQRDVRTRDVAASVGALIGLAAAGSYYYFDLCRQDPAGCNDEQRRAARATEYDHTYITTGDVLAIGGFIAGGLLGYALAPAPHWELIATPAVEHGPQGESHTSMRIGLARRLLGR